MATTLGSQGVTVKAVSLVLPPVPDPILCGPSPGPPRLSAREAPTATVKLQERLSELTAHGTVEGEVYGVVDQRADVHDVPEWDVDVQEEAGPAGTEHYQHALRELGDQEQDDHSNEHLGSTAVLVEFVVVGGGDLQKVLSLVDLHPHLVQEERAEEKHKGTRDELSENGVHPDVGQHQRVRVVGAESEVFQDVDGFVRRGGAVVCGVQYPVGAIGARRWAHPGFGFEFVGQVVRNHD